MQVMLVIRLLLIVLVTKAVSSLSWQQELVMVATIIANNMRTNTNGSNDNANNRKNDQDIECT